ncbi:MAG: hypothetical protein ACXV3S_00025 [Kineosporiaceae bacterium]
MPNVRDILRRFRPAAAPGPAATGGVPADRVAEREAELAPVLALLEEVEQECAQLLEAARTAAAERRSQGAGQVEAILAAGRRRADAERAAAAAAQQRLADEEAQRIVRDGRDQARRTVEAARRRLPELVAAAAEQVRVLLATPQDDALAGRPNATVPPAGTP